MGIVVTQDNIAEAIEDLRTFLLNGTVEKRDVSFATDLVSGKYGWDKRGYLSDKQIKFIGPMIDRALGGDSAPAAESVGSLEGFVKLFTDAKANLKFPKIVMESKDEPLKFTIAGDKAKFPGTINITDGGSYGSNKWYGRVTVDGEWTPSGTVTPELKHIIGRVLNAFSNDPKKAAMSYGHASNNCCFCAKKLDTKESVHAGYGPVCADKWGLPWGDTE